MRHYCLKQLERMFSKRERRSLGQAVVEDSFQTLQKTLSQQLALFDVDEEKSRIIDHLTEDIVDDLVNDSAEAVFATLSTTI